MAELWIPQPDKTPDVTNMFDMMMVFQERIDSVWDREAKIYEARIALKALAINLKQMDEDARQVTIVTGIAIVDSTNAKGSGSLVKEVGLNGFIDDVHCVRVGETIPMSVSIGLEAFTIFPADDPEDADLVLSNAKAPINSVRYIERLAS